MSKVNVRPINELGYRACIVLENGVDYEPTAFTLTDEDPSTIAVLSKSEHRLRFEVKQSAGGAVHAATIMLANNDDASGASAIYEFPLLAGVPYTLTVETLS